MSVSEKQLAPGDIKYFHVKVDGFDITGMVLSAEVFQEIFTPSWSCQVAFSDTQNLIMNLPIKPGSEVEIVAETEQPTVKKKVFKFYVYKVSNRTVIKQEHQAYILHCVTDQFFLNQKKRVQKSLKNLSADKMVGTLLSENGMGSVEADTDSNKYSVIVPNMAPFAAIAWVSRFARNSQGAADFMFYQSDIGGKFKFKSLDKMFYDRSGITLKTVNPNKRDNSNRENKANFLNIEQYEFLTQHNAMNNYSTGYYGNTLLTHDIVSKSYDETTFKYGDDISKDADKKPFDGNFFVNPEPSNITFHPQHTGIIKKGITVPGDTSPEWVGSRKTNVMKLEENRLVVTLPGAVSHYELLGKQVDVELPSHQDADDGQHLDKYMKGSYVVSAIRHIFNTGEYKTVMELGKKRLEKPYE